MSQRRKASRALGHAIEVAIGQSILEAQAEGIGVSTPLVERQVAAREHAIAEFFETEESRLLAQSEAVTNSDVKIRGEPRKV